MYNKTENSLYGHTLPHDPEGEILRNIICFYMKIPVFYFAVIRVPSILGDVEFLPPPTPIKSFEMDKKNRVKFSSRFLNV